MSPDFFPTLVPPCYADIGITGWKWDSKWNSKENLQKWRANPARRTSSKRRSRYNSRMPRTFHCRAEQQLREVAAHGESGTENPSSDPPKPTHLALRPDGQHAKFVFGLAKANAVGLARYDSLTACGRRRNAVEHPTNLFRWIVPVTEGPTTG